MEQKGLNLFWRPAGNPQGEKEQTGMLLIIKQVVMMGHRTGNESSPG